MMGPLSTLLTAFIFVHIGRVSCAPSPQPTQASIALHVVTLQWPYSFCRIERCSKRNLPQYFTLHGLWPAYANGSSQTDCDGETFDAIKLKNLAQTLPSIWRSFTRKSNEEFWQLEWNRHGKCSGLSLYEYFGRAIRLGNEGSNAVLLALQHAGITPSSSRAGYIIQRYSNAVFNHMHVKPVIRCSRNQTYLLEIGLCVDLRFNFKNCPRDFEGCGTQAIIRTKGMMFPNN